MVKLNPQYIKDNTGQTLVVLLKKEYEQLIEQLEDLEDIKLYDEAKKNDDGERIAMEDAFDLIEKERANNL